MPSRRRVFLPLLSLTALVTAVGCAPPPDLDASDRLDALLLGADAYPTGFTVQTVDTGDLADLDGTAVSGASFDRVEPAECADAVDGGAAALPVGAVEGAGQVATASAPPLVYTYVLVSGDFPEGGAAVPGWSELLERCSETTVATEAFEAHGGLTAEGSPSLPEGGGMFAMSLTGDGVDLFSRAAWGQVGDVYFVLMSLDLDPAPEVSTPELVDACIEDPADTDCVGEQRRELADQARAEAAAEFESVLSRAVDTLEEGA
ncbi:hypothetical protein ACIBFB_25865 [Nocardiopsis sp. NPDC050513]|uniref:hypothetical protein n=1 Tax=Nocardiopsis sp. NPDC050513 TaxID=3364338 RepID=UPI003791A3DE